MLTPVITKPIGGSKRLDFLRHLGDAVSGTGGVGCLDVSGRSVYLVNDGDLVSELLQRRADALEKSEFQHEVMGGTEALGPGFGNGLLTSSSRAHKRQYKLIGRVFDKRHLEHYASIMAACAEEAISTWRSGDEVGLQGPLMDIAVQSLGRSLLSTDFGAERARVTAMILGLTDAIGGANRQRKEAKANAEELKRLIAYGHDLVDRMILARVDVPPRALPDMIDVLFEARREDAAALRAGERPDYLASDRQLHDELVTMLFTGSENPKNSLLWALWLIAGEPGVKARLFEEIDAVLGDRAIVHDDVERLAYTTQVFKEALRLYPPGYAFGRRTTEDIQLGDTRIPRGSEILVSPYLLHRRPAWFPDPERFDPSRFSPENEAKLPRTAFMPFGVGARACIGGGFAMLEGPIVLATLLRRFDVSLADGAEIEARATITLRPKGDLRLRLSGRPRGHVAP